MRSVFENITLDDPETYTLLTLIFHLQTYNTLEQDFKSDLVMVVLAAHVMNFIANLSF